MTSPMEYLTDLEGTEIAFDAVPESPFCFPAKTWVLVKKLDEDADPLTQKEVTDGIGISDTSAKFLCRPAGPDNAAEYAFMRIHQQVPIIGTEVEKASIRASQAVEEPENRELVALKSFFIRGCEVVPKLLGFHQGKQDEDEGVPGGFITYIVWEKSPGESFDPVKFWLWPFSERKAFRDKFRKMFGRFLTFGFMPLMPIPSKIIYDEPSGQMHISGFRFAYHLEEPEKWDEYFFFRFALALRSREPDAYLQGIESNEADWVEDDNGYIW
ncbi:hypothetical protein PENPOL_c006G04774 [Penicillium polonicum]|uniref:Uncharacterized protein n=1 Tax=Penicillium polonicum TaxID=60169 RepID=A0A1V6NLH2_PENPO|nr:hypothetical protein PENPOL_c006G04774 [Penicillium polonicum]